MLMMPRLRGTASVVAAAGACARHTRLWLLGACAHLWRNVNKCSELYQVLEVVIMAPCYGFISLLLISRASWQKLTAVLNNFPP